MKCCMNVRKCVTLLVCLALLTGLCTAFIGCEKASPSDTGCTVIICTNYAALQLARGVLLSYQSNGGEGVVQLLALGNQGQDMHSYEPTAKDIIELASADVVVCAGAEGWLDAALSSAGNGDVTRVTMMEVCDTVDGDHDHDHDHDHSHGGEDCSLIGQDEHVWLSVDNAIRITEALEKALCRVDEASASAWQACGAAFRNELVSLKADYAAMMATAARDTVVIADRYPFAYLFRELGLNCVAAFPGCSSETSASFATQTRLIETVKELSIPYVFVMEGSDRKVAEVVARETGAGILTLDSMQVMKDFSASASYVEIMRKNLENLKKALQ